MFAQSGVDDNNDDDKDDDEEAWFYAIIHLNLTLLILLFWKQDCKSSGRQGFA